MAAPVPGLIERLRAWPARHDGGPDTMDAKVVGELMREAADEIEASWRPVRPDPEPGVRVDLTDGVTVEPNCYWGLGDVGWSQSGYMMWIMAPKRFRPTHYRPARAL